MYRQMNNILPACCLVVIIGCGADDIVPVPEPNEEVVGFTTVELDANKAVVRGGESPLGNLIADSFLLHAQAQGYAVDFAMANGGNIRFNSATRTDGIYPSGNITQDDINELLPFRNTGIIIQITGQKLKSTLERSVHSLPVPQGSSGNGAFAQLSSGIQIKVDLSRQPQVVDDLNEVETIAVEGERVVQITIGGLPLALEQHYLVLIPSYAAGGGDGYVILRDIEPDRKIDLQQPLYLALQEYLLVNSPITPIIENRIVIE